MDDSQKKPVERPVVTVETTEQPAPPPKPKPKEFGGPAGPEPTRYGDWERKGICVDF